MQVFQKWTSSLAEGAQAVIHISVSHNNTILALQDPNGHKKAWSSAGEAHILLLNLNFGKIVWPPSHICWLAGTVGYKKSKRSSSMAAADAAASLVQKARDMGINTVRCCLETLNTQKFDCPYRLLG